MDQPSSSKNMKWMYEGTKSLINREDYLLGKKIDKNFELYSDVVVKDKEEEGKQEFFKRDLIESGHGGVNHKISALDTRIVRSEDPLVALRFQETQRRQKMLDNPLLKLKAQRVLKKAFEKQLKKEMDKKHKNKRKSRSSSSSEEEYEERKRRGRSHRRERRGNGENRKLAEIGESEKKQRQSSLTRSRSRIRDHRRRDKSSSHSKGHHQSRSWGVAKRNEYKDGRWNERRGNREQSREEKRRNEREESKQRDERKQHQPSTSMKRPKLTAQEMEKRREAMMANANWRDEQREQNIVMAAEELRKEEADAQRNMGPSFIKPLLDSTSANSSLEKRLQSNRMNIQRTHDHMNKSFTRK